MTGLNRISDSSYTPLAEVDGKVLLSAHLQHKRLKENGELVLYYILQSGTHAQSVQGDVVEKMVAGATWAGVAFKTTANVMVALMAAIGGPLYQEWRKNIIPETDDEKMAKKFLALQQYENALLHVLQSEKVPGMRIECTPANGKHPVDSANDYDERYQSNPRHKLYIDIVTDLQEWRVRRQSAMPEEQIVENIRTIAEDLLRKAAKHVVNNRERGNPFSEWDRFDPPISGRSI